MGYADFVDTFTLFFVSIAGFDLRPSCDLRFQGSAGVKRGADHAVNRRGSDDAMGGMIGAPEAGDAAFGC